MRLNKFLAHAGVASRRKADELIRSATTTVNGKMVTDPALDVNSTDDIYFDGSRIKISDEMIVWMLHKPIGFITSVSDPEGRRTVMELVPVKERMFPIGRLDQDTTGLLLLTNDGELSQALLHPKYKIPRKYIAVTDRPIQPKEIQKLKRGMHIWDNIKGKAKVNHQKTVKKRTTIELELRQGKKREIRRIMDRLKIKLFSLHRSHFGSLSLGNLKQGEARKLTDSEKENLQAICGLNNNKSSEKRK